MCGGHMRNIITPLPTHLDFTTLYAAALALSTDTRKTEGLPMSRLLALSQLVESIVLHDSLQYESADTPYWAPYQDALDNSIVSRLGRDFGVPLRASAPVDSDESSVLYAIGEAAKAIRTMTLEPLRWAVQLRGGTFAAVPNVTDLDNPVHSRYLELARSVDDPSLRDDLSEGLLLLRNNGVSVLGLHVLIRLILHQAHWVSGRRANYYPHFSRQALLAKLGNPCVSTENWTMSELAKARGKIAEMVTSDQPVDPLARSLSPIFIACLANARRPEDIIDEAIDLRNTGAAIEYRKERDEVLASSVDGDQMRYRARLALRLSELRDLLFERGSEVAYERRWVFQLSWIPVGWTYAVKRSDRPARFPGDRAALFIGDVILQSLGVIQSADRIREIFGTSVTYDTGVLEIRE